MPPTCLYVSFFFFPPLPFLTSTRNLPASSSQRLRGLFKVPAAARKRKRDLSRKPRHLDDERGGGEARDPNHQEAATIQLVLERRIDVLPRDDVAEGATLLRWDREEAEEGRRGGTRAQARAFGSGEQYHRDGDTRTSWKDRDLRVVQLFAEYLPSSR